MCPFVQPVDSSLIGIDRTASFQSANGTQVSFTIHAPVTTSTVTISPCNGAGGCDDRSNINAALVSGVKIQLQAGDYYINPPNSGNPFNINFNVASDQILQGAGKDITILHFNLPPNLGTAYGFAIPGGARNMIRDLSVMWQPINAIPGVVTTVGGNQRFTVNNPTYYIPNPVSPPIGVFSSNGYDTTNFTFINQTGGRAGVLGPFNTNFAMDGLYYYAFSGIHFPNNTTAVMWVNQTKETFHLADTQDVTIANVAVYGGSGPGLTFVDIGTNNAGGLWMVNSNITRKPNSLLQPGEQPSYVALFGDNDMNSTTGRALIENNEFAYIGDDAFAFGGGFTKQTASVISTSRVTFTQSSPLINHTQNDNDLFEFNDVTTQAPLGGPQLGTWTQTCVGPCPGGGSTYTLDVTFATPMPGLAPYIGGSPIWGRMPGYANPNVILRNNCVHDMVGRFTITANNHTLIQNNTFGNIYFGPIVSSWAPTIAATAGFADTIIEGNRLVGINYGQQDFDWLGNSTHGIMTGLPSGAIIQGSFVGTAASAGGFAPVPLTGDAFGGYPSSGFEIKNNFISSTPGVAITVGGSNNVGVVNNTIVDANTVAFIPSYQSLYCGVGAVGVPIIATNICPNLVAGQQAIDVWHSSNVDTTSTPNTCLGTTVGCVFIDPSLSSVLYNDIVSSRFLH